MRLEAGEGLSPVPSGKDSGDGEDLRATWRALFIGARDRIEREGRGPGEARRALLDVANLCDLYDVSAGEAHRAVGDAVAKTFPQLPRAVTVCLADVRTEKVLWLWPGRIPFGKVSILDGDPGLGKSTLTLDVAARLTTGRDFPDGAACEPGAVVVLSAEDGLADTIRPRLDAAGADVNRVVAVTGVQTPGCGEKFVSLSQNVEEIEWAVRESGAKLLIVDPLMAFIGGQEINSYKDQDVRRVLAPLGLMAERTGAAVVLVRHLRKGSRADGALYAGGGSIGIAGAARSVLLVARDPDDRERRIVAAVKSNLCPEPPSLAYRIESDRVGRPWIAWEAGTVDFTADRLLAAAAEGEDERGARAEAVAWLGYFLADGPHAAPEIIREGRKAGHSEKTLRRASSAVRVQKRKDGLRGGWSWALPSEDGHEEPKMAKMANPKSWPSSESVGHLRADGPSSSPPVTEEPPPPTPPPADEEELF